jgi:peptidoglycan/xylan/chitin deacetylase (PgdA/CDA1 family)
MIIQKFAAHCSLLLQKVMATGVSAPQRQARFRRPQWIGIVMILTGILFFSQFFSWFDRVRVDHAVAQPSTVTPTPNSIEVISSLLRQKILLILQAKQSAESEEAFQLMVPLIMRSDHILAPTATPTDALTRDPLSEPTPDGQERTVRVPILMYHYLSVPPADADIYRKDLSVTPDNFAQHLDRMQAAGYTTIYLNDLLLHLTQGDPLPEKPVILTFDDGYRDNYLNAFPLLRERGMTATFFIVTDFIDEERPEYMTWDMVREMYAAGMAMESHGRNHTSLKDRDEDYLVWQALGSLETIEFELGVRPRFISYPTGAFDEKTIEIFQSAHYWAGVTTIQGATHQSDELFELRRVRVRGTHDADELLRLLSVDW